MDTTSSDTIDVLDDVATIDDDPATTGTAIASDDALDDELATLDAEFDREPIVAGGLFVARSDIHGTGVFASRSFEVDDVIEQCPVLLVGPDHAARVATTTFGDYVYEWEGGYALALGFGSLYNHSRQPVARYEMDYELDEIHVVALGAISAGDEITINYNGDPTDQSPVWFEPDA